MRSSGSHSGFFVPGHQLPATLATTREPLVAEVRRAGFVPWPVRNTDFNRRDVMLEGLKGKKGAQRRLQDGCKAD